MRTKIVTAVSVMECPFQYLLLIRLFWNVINKQPIKNANKKEKMEQRIVKFGTNLKFST
jgi:hypothetical protein